MRKIQDVSKVLSEIYRSSGVLKCYTPIGSHVNENGKKKRKKEIVKISIFKSPKHNFVRTIRKKIQEKFDKFRLRFVRGVAF